MKKNKAIFLSAAAELIVVVVALVEVRSHAQSPTTQSNAPSVSPPTQSAMPGELQNSLDAQGRGRYLVGPGDILDVRVFGQPDLNSTVEIDDEGNISSLPFLEEPIPAMCRNEKDIQKSIAKAYSRYIKNPRVSVLVKERRSRPPAVVFGAVRAPTRIQMMRRARLHEVLVAAGGVTLSASGKIQIVHTEREMCPQDSIPTPDIAEGLSSSTFDKAALTEKSDAPVMSPISNNSSYTATASTAASKPQAVSSFSGQQGSKPVAKTDDKTEASVATDASEGKKPLIGPLDIGHIDIYEIDTVRNGVGSTDPYIRPGDIVIVTEGEPIYSTGYFNEI